MDNNEQEINNTEDVVREYPVDPRYALLLKHSSFKANLEGESSVRIEIISFGSIDDPKADGIIRITGEEQNALVCIGTLGLSRKNKGFHEIDVLKDVVDIMFERYKKDISAMKAEL